MIADSQTAALAVKAGAVDIVNTNDPIIAIEYQNTPGVVVIAKTALRTDYLEINTTVKPFDNVKVRQAMLYAIDYPGLVSAVLRGYGTAGYSGIMMPGMTGFDPSVNVQNTYDPAKARQLLRESGVKLPINGFFTTYNDTLDINAAQFIAANLAQFGINMEPRPLERGTLVQERIKATTPASVIGTAVSPDPDGLFSLTFIGAGQSAGRAQHRAVHRDRQALRRAALRGDPGGAGPGPAADPAAVYRRRAGGRVLHLEGDVARQLAGPELRAVRAVRRRPARAGDVRQVAAPGAPVSR